MLRGRFTKTGPVQPFLTGVTVACKVDLVTSRSPFFSKGGELERTIKGSCSITFSLGVDEDYKLSSENCLTLEAGARSGVMCWWWAAIIFSPGLFATENTSLTLVGFY